MENLEKVVREAAAMLNLRNKVTKEHTTWYIYIYVGDVPYTSNVQNYNHVLTSCYLKIALTELSETLSVNPYFARTFYTDKEFEHKFRHGHCSVNASLRSWTLFCVGKDSAIDGIQKKVAALNTELTSEYLAYYITSLIGILGQEHDSGVYQRYSSVVAESSNIYGRYVTRPEDIDLFLDRKINGFWEGFNIREEHLSVTADSGQFYVGLRSSFWEDFTQHALLKYLETGDNYGNLLAVRIDSINYNFDAMYPLITNTEKPVIEGAIQITDTGLFLEIADKQVPIRKKTIAREVDKNLFKTAKIVINVNRNNIEETDITQFIESYVFSRITDKLSV